MSLDYYSDAVFSLHADEVVARAAADHMIWALLSYAQQWCVANAFAPKGINILIRCYGMLGCHANCWFLVGRYPPGILAKDIGTPGTSAGLGLMLHARIEHTDKGHEAPQAESLWHERDNIVRLLRENPQSLPLWLQLATKYIELEEMLMSLWTVLVIKMNTSDPRAVIPALLDQVNLMAAHESSGCLWSFLGHKDTVSELIHIMDSAGTTYEMASSVESFAKRTLGLPLRIAEILSPFAWAPPDGGIA